MLNRLHAIRLVVFTAAWAALPAPAPALIHYDFEQALFSESPEPVLDHCVVEQDGLYHLFYLRGNPAVNIGHATTTDFIHWQTLPPVLAPGPWDTRLWAPFVVRRNDAWLMYYTGVNAYGAQQTGIADSENLYDWFKLTGPNYHPDPSWALWNEGEFSHGRDPHVLEHNGRYYMFVTAKTWTNKGAVGCAVSDDLVHWQDIGPVYVHDTWHVLESVFFLKHNSKWHMFFTEEAVYGTSEMESDSLLSGWNISNRVVIDMGHAPQITNTALGEMFSRHGVYNDLHGTTRYVLRFSPMVWQGDQPVVPRYLPLYGTWTFTTGDAFYYQPTYGNNAYVRNEGYPTSFVGDGWVNTYEYYTGPMGYGQPGDKFGDYKVGVMRSPTFSIQGNSMSLLVGGGNDLARCYVALVDAGTGQVLFRETGQNSDVMDKRYWNLVPHKGKSVYIEIADTSTDPFGHVDVDEIVESYEVLAGGSAGPGRDRRVPTIYTDPAAAPVVAAGTGPRLLPNVPNPFNPSTTIAFEIPRAGRVRVDVFDTGGALVHTLIDGPRRAGRGEITWRAVDARGRALASGVYFYRLLFDGREIETRKMVLLK